MFGNIVQFFKRFKKSEKEESKSTAKERLHLVLAQDRANISADFLEMMKQEILEVIKKYIDIDEKAIDVRLTNKEGEDGSIGAPALYANIPIITIKNDARKLEGTLNKEENKENNKVEDKKEKEGDNKEVATGENKGKDKEAARKDVEGKAIEPKVEEKAEHVDENNYNSTSNNEVSSNPQNDEQENNSNTVNAENDNLNEDDNEKKNS